MKTYIIYNEENTSSVKNARGCLNSFQNFLSWQPSLYDGCTPRTLHIFEDKYKLKNDRARYQPKDDFYKNKKSCFYSHFSLWIKCIELNEKICIVENDTYCADNLPESFSFDSIVQFSAESMFKTNDKRYAKYYEIYKNLKPGLHSMELFPPIKYKGRSWGHCIAGNTAYGISPSSAELLVSDCLKNGWQQNDLLMSTSLCKIEIMVPSIIVYDSNKELSSSSFDWK
jgi:GR25 family glycosyltransferase involved in LPS biosynthesis